MNRSSCIRRGTRKPLRSYFSRSEAELAAEYVLARFGHDQVPYRCRTCESWHLTPRERHTPSFPCPDCTSGGGEPKASYETEDAAERRASILRRERGVSLRVYDCPYGNGWHLTSS